MNNREFSVLLRVFVLASATLPWIGCAAAPKAPGPVERMTLKRRALDTLHSAIRYEHNAAVRSLAVEALQRCGVQETRAWIRHALYDNHAGVRFAACMAVGHLEDREALSAVTSCLDDEDASVRVAALLAIHRFGRVERTGQLATYLLSHAEVTVRRNAALALGLLGEKDAVRVLAKAMKDPDRGARHHALEAMARLGNEEARQELLFLCNSGIGSEEVFAIDALAATGESEVADTLRYKLNTGSHLETRLAAARGLGRLGHDDGFETGLKALVLDRPILPGKEDSPQEQVFRSRQMAAGALGAIARVDALTVLARILDRDEDPRIGVSAAGAILEIMAVDRDRSLPFSVGDNR